MGYFGGSNEESRSWVPTISKIPRSLQVWVRHSEESPGLPRGVARVKAGHPEQKKLEGSVGSDGYGARSSLVGMGSGKLC